MVETSPLIIYHYDEDGFGAVWAFLHLCDFDREKVELLPSGYQKPTVDVSNRDVYLLDICFEKEVMLRLQEEAASLTVLDHHPKAQEAQEYLKPGTVAYSNKYSACVLVWETYAGLDSDRPWLLSYIQDRDLWQWKLPHSKEVNSYLNMLPHDFKVWDKVLSQSPEEILEAATVARRAVQSYTTATVSQARMVRIAGCLVPIINAPYWFVSDLLDILTTTKVNPGAQEGDLWREVTTEKEYALNPQFALAWYETAAGGRKFSIRSTNRGLFGYSYDVSVVAESYGGGGHRNASGFYLPPGVKL